jgi:hypothetical protein
MEVEVEVAAEVVPVEELEVVVEIALVGEMEVVVEVDPAIQSQTQASP